MLFLNRVDVQNIIMSPGFGFKLENDERGTYNYDPSHLLDQMDYELHHPLRLYWIFTLNDRYTGFSNRDGSSLQSWYLTDASPIKKGFFGNTSFAAFTPYYNIEEEIEEPQICIQLNILKQFMVGMQREFPERFSNAKLERVIGLHFGKNK